MCGKWLAYWREDPLGALRSALRSALWCAWHRFDNRRQDVWAGLRGACNRDTWDDRRVSYCGGYSHWRCGRERGHAGDHRFINYVWPGPGSRVHYDPLPVRNADNTGWYDTRRDIPFRHAAQGRHLIDSMRRSRQRARHAELERARRWALR